MAENPFVTTEYEYPSSDITILPLPDGAPPSPHPVTIIHDTIPIHLITRLVFMLFFFMPSLSFFDCGCATTPLLLHSPIN
jgi:hypothetical protein